MCVSVVSVVASPAFAAIEGDSKQTFKVVNVAKNSVLNVRSRPSGNVIGGLQPDSTIMLTGACRASWCPIQHEAKAGWVYRAYLAATSDAPVAAPVAAAPARGAPVASAAPALPPAPAAKTAPKVAAKSPPEIAFEYFLEKGWSAHQAAGIVGNLQTECGANFHCSTHSGGIAQWRAERITRFRQIFGFPFAKASLKDQLDYIQWELMHPNSPWKDSGRILKTAKDEVTAATLFDVHYERSAGTSRGPRIANARAILKRFGAKSAS